MKKHSISLTIILLTLFLFSCDSGSKGGGAIAKALAPPVPSLAVKQKDLVASLSWKKVAGADYYEIYKGANEKPLGAKKIATAKSAKAVSYSDEKVKVGETYYYWLKSCSKALCSKFSKVSKLTVTPLSPINLSVNRGEEKIEISWQAVKGADAYQVQRGFIEIAKKSKKAEKSKAKTIATIKGSTYTDEDIEADKTYFYTVRACKAKVCSSASESTALSKVTFPAPDLSVSQKEKLEAELTWPAVAGATSYKLYRLSSTEIKLPIEKHIVSAKLKLDGGKYTYTDKLNEADIGKDYYYFIRACDGSKCSEASGRVALRGIKPSAPSISSISQKGLKARLQWKPVAGADSYKLYEKDGKGNLDLEGNKRKLGEKVKKYETKPLTAKKTYRYGLKACNNEICSEMSDEVTLKILDKPTIKLTEKEDGQLEITWEEVDDAATYYLYKSTDTSISDSEKVGDGFLAGSRKFTDTKRVALQAYNYAVEACHPNNGGCSEHDPKESTRKAKLNDTGLTCNDDSKDGEDCKHGRDGDEEIPKVGSGQAGFDFTKIAEDGTPLKVQDGTYNKNGTASAGTEWACVRDNVTGLMWQRDKSGDSGAAVGSVVALDADIDAANGKNDNSINGGKGLCGVKLWRRPVREEIRSIVDYGGDKPALDTDYFSGDVASLSSIQQENTEANLAIRLVTTGSATAANLNLNLGKWEAARYDVGTGTGTVKDKSTGLMWTRCALGLSGASCAGTAKELTWANALKAAEDLNKNGFAGKIDWRVPNLKELASLIKSDAAAGVAINATAFPGIADTDGFWTSSPAAADNNGNQRAWALKFAVTGSPDTASDVGPEKQKETLKLLLVRDAE